MTRVGVSHRTDASEGLTEEQLQAVRRWERVISEVAAQEMLHLASASNLLTAIGGAPHFGRPNFPQPAKYYPPGFELALMPFSEQALGIEFYRTSYLLPHRHAAWVLMNERLLELADYCTRLGAHRSAPQQLTTIEESFRKLARALEQHIG